MTQLANINLDNSQFKFGGRALRSSPLYGLNWF